MDIISFDFDSILSRKDVQEFAQECLQLPNLEVIIITTRFEKSPITHITLEDHNQDLFTIMKNLGIEKVFFTSGRDKSITINTINNERMIKGLRPLLWHLDDDSYELDEINSHTKTVGISAWNTNKWRLKCRKILLQHNIQIKVPDNF